MKNTWRARLKPLEVEREIRDDLYLIVFSVHIGMSLKDPRLSKCPVLRNGLSA